MPERYSAKQILASSPVAMALMRGTRCVFANEAFAEAVGHPLASLLNSDLFSVVAPEDLEKTRARNAARRAGEPAPNSYEINVVGADGVVRRLETEPRVLDDGDTLICVRPLGDAGKRKDFLLSLAELQARAQRERTVQGVLDVSTRGLKELAVYSTVVRAENGFVRLVAAAPADELAAILNPVLEMWRVPPGFEVAKLVALRQVIEEQRPLLLDDLVPVTRNFLAGRSGASADQLASVAGLITSYKLVITPLTVQGKPWGAVLSTGKRLQSADLAALMLFSQQLGAMIEVAENIEALERQNRLLEAIHKVARLRTELSVEQLVPELLRILAPATDSDDAAIFIAEPGGEWLSLAGTTAPGTPFATKYSRIPVQRSATGSAVLMSAPRAISLDEWPAVSREDVRAEGYKQLAIVPLQANGRVHGTLNLSRRRDERYDLGHLREAEMLLAQVGLQVERARLLEEARHRVEDLSLLNEVGGLISQHLDLQSVTTVAMSHVSRLVVVQNTFLFLLDDETRKLHMAATNLPNDPLDMVLELSQSSAACDAVNRLKPVLIEDAESDPCASKPPANRYGHKALLAVPLLSEGKPIGSLVLGETKTKRRFTGNEVDLAVAIANQLSSAITNARLFEASKESFRKLAEAQAELVKRERLAALGELSAVVAHEVRNPVAVIFNSLAGIQKLGPIDGEAGELLGIVNEEAERLSRMVTDLLDFASPHQAKKRAQRLEPLLADALQAATRIVGAPKVKLTLAVLPEASEVPVDPPLLRQAVMNLLINALQALPEGGEVAVHARCDERNGQRVARIDVSDNGPGICPEDAEKIFQPFFTRRAKGTGLGLAVVKRIAEAHQAEVSVQSAPGRGSTFSLWLPM